MKKFLKLMIISLFVIVNIVSLQAATGSVKYSISSDEPTIGSTITIKLTITCAEGVGGGRFKLSYQDEYFSDLSLSSSSKDKASLNEKTKVLVLEPKALTSVTVSLTLKTKKVGKSDIKITAEGLISYDPAENFANYTKSYIKSIDIKEKTSSSTDKPSSSLSTDANLSSLSIEGVKLIENFSKDNYEYTAYAPLNTQNLNIIAKANNVNATIGKINSNVNEGWNDIEITCTSESGKKKVYLVHVYVEEKPSIYISENLGVVKNLDLITIPEGFIEESIDFNQQQITMFNQGKINIVYLMDENANKDFYIYSLTNQKLEGIYRPLEFNNKLYLSKNIDYENFKDMNEKFEQSSFEFDGITVSGWKYKEENMKDYQLLYLMDFEGNSQIYSYDEIENTLQRFTLPYQEILEEKKDYKEIIEIGIMAGSGFCLLSALLLLTKVAKIRKELKGK